MAQEESWKCPVTTKGKYVKGLLENIHYWKSLEDLKSNIMLINEALDIPYEKNEELEELKIKKLQELCKYIDYELLPDHYKRNKDIIMSWKANDELYIDDIDSNIIDKDVLLIFIEHGEYLKPEDIPNQYKKDKDVILGVLRNSFTSMGFDDDACIWMDDELKKDKEFIMELIKKKLINYDTFIKEISSHFKSDKDIILAFLQNVKIFSCRCEDVYKTLFDWIDETLKDDKEFMKKLIDCEKKLRDKYPYVFKK